MWQIVVNVRQAFIQVHEKSHLSSPFNYYVVVKQFL